MSTDAAIEECIETAAEAVGSVWPLHSFVTANPLSGFEDRPFHEAVSEAEQLLGGDGYPSAEVFRRALEAGQIDPAVLRSELAASGYDVDPEATLERMAATEPGDTAASATATDRVDAVLTKWLAAFLDQGQAEWAMPSREQGFYEAFRTVAPHDGEIPGGDVIAALPDSPTDAVRECLDDQPVGEWQDIFESQLAALPGWTGFIKQRAADGDAWQSTYPITLTEYLAVRLALVDLFDAPLAPSSDAAEDGTDAAGEVPLPAVWLTAWERSYRADLVEELAAESDGLSTRADDGRPDAQLVFCIDTRSEIIRRHIEAAGNYDTHGYAGFFGVPMRYDDYDSAVTVDACPPILDAEHRIAERPAEDAGDRREYDRLQATLSAAREAIESLESNAATAFSFVESAGVGYGAALAGRTLLPARVSDLLGAADARAPDDHEFCEPAVDHDPESGDDLPAGLTLAEKVEYAATAFELMGWERFARVVVFAGHASQTANNPFDSSLDCGACAGNPGGPSARVLATICNDEEVRASLRERGIEIPEDTVFVAGEHNTTTDEVELFASDVPETHEADIEQLRADLAEAREGAAAERAGDMGATTNAGDMGTETDAGDNGAATDAGDRGAETNAGDRGAETNAGDMGAEADAGVRETERRAADWAETRPEWGLAGNAGFVVGPRELTEDLDLDGRAFLHSYDWRTDEEGDALEAILAGPMVVTQWINTQYYFATVDNATYGSGSKVTHNPVGNVGVYQGNGGDLMAGLPLQSLLSADDEPYHQPIRLSTVVHAPVERVTEVLADNEELVELLDNDWLSLTVIDPTQDHRALQYEADLEWTPVDEQRADAERATRPSTADD